MKKQLIRDQLDEVLASVANLASVEIPKSGWIKSIRVALNMSLRQLGKRIGIIIPSMKELEDREQSGTITLNKLREAGAALNLKLVYAFIPEDGSLEAMIEKRARQLAREIVERTSTSMALEDQENRLERLHKAVEEKTAELVREVPRYLWD